MANLGSLSVFLTANTTPFQKSMFQARKSMAGLSRGVKLASAAIAGGLAAIGISGLRLATDAEEIEGKFGVVFGAIPDMAKEAADKISKDFDLADSSVQKMLSSTGDLLTGFGFAQGSALKLSERVSRLAGDLASFQNISGGAAEAAERLTKGILGETENLKSLGIVVRQDTKEFKGLVAELVKTQGLTVQQAKAQTILDAAFKQSKNAIGDYARTQESAANSVKRLSEAWKQFREGFGEVIKQLIMFTTGSGKNFASTLKDIGDSLKTIGKEIKNLSKAGGFRNLLLLAGTGRSAAQLDAAAIEDEVDTLIGRTGADSLSGLSAKGRESIISKAIANLPGLSQQGIELFKAMLPAFKEQVAAAKAARKEQVKDRAKALEKPKAVFEPVRPVEDVEALRHLFSREDEKKQAASGPALSEAIRAGSQAEAALLARAMVPESDKKLRKKNVDANIATANELKIQNERGVKVRGMKVVNSVQ